MDNLKIDTTQNNIICGDAKEWLPCIPDKSIDLIYIDPPFFSNKNYEVIWGNGHEIRSFGDRWKGGINHYIGWIRDKLLESHRVLKDTGSILLHCDYHANHHLRILLDEIFGANNFVNEVIWHYFMGGKAKKFYSRKHDNIYWYSKTKKFTFNYETKLRMLPKKPTLGNHKGILEKDGVYYSKVGCDDVFDLSGVFNMSKEYIGYRTQKPEKLISQFIRQLSNKNDVILDFFGGGGTTAKVCSDLGRVFITGDVSPVSIRVIKDRLREAECYNFIECNPYLTKVEWSLVNGHKFAEKVCEYMKWQVNPKKSGDGGIDGWIDDLKKIPVQIKNSAVNVSVVRDLAGVCNATYKMGVVVGWSFSKGCYEFVSELERKSGIKIELKLADTIVKPIEYMKKAEWQKLYSERVIESKRKPQFIDTNLGGQKEMFKKDA